MSSRSFLAATIFYSVALIGFAGCGSDDSSSPAPAAQRELITNGSFESPKVADTTSGSNAFSTYGAVTKAVTGWTVANVDLVHRLLWPAASGNQSIDLNGAEAGRIARRVDTKAGSSYTLAFSFATNPAADAYVSADTRMCRVLWNQVPVETLSVMRTASIAWKRHSVVLAAKGNDSLQIESINAGRAGVALDSLSLMGP